MKIYPDIYTPYSQNNNSKSKKLLQHSQQYISGDKPVQVCPFLTNNGQKRAKFHRQQHLFKKTFQSRFKPYLGNHCTALFYGQTFQTDSKYPAFDFKIAG